jgi:histidyl-tRNA synthetase
MKPSIPKGTRDFSPEEMRKRNFIFDTLKGVFQLYGYQQIETPAMENLSTLLGKYGEEGDKLLFRILDSGNYLNKESVRENIKSFLNIADTLLGSSTESEGVKNINTITQDISEKGLRYDLTVPFARYVVQNRNDITFPFKRFQVQPVWRADRPQKGRYREFYQCDVDVVGSDSLLNEAELIQIIDQAFILLGLRTVIKLNNRKILSGIAEIIGEPDRIVDITVAIDKLDKIGLEKVCDELRERGVADASIVKLQPLFELSGNNEEKLGKLKAWIASSEVGLKGIDELQTVFDYLKLLDISTRVELDLTLARGLNYYTGAIFEVKALDAEIGSICGGGRYDNLTGIFGLPDVSGVGISFGADRIYDVMSQLSVFPTDTSQSTQILFINFGSIEEMYCLPLVQRLRKAGIKAELFPGSARMNKQMNYANTRKIPFVALIGETEMKEGLITLKDMLSGEQTKLSFDELTKKLL